jgi:hypothetical protein
LIHCKRQINPTLAFVSQIAQAIPRIATGAESVNR